MSPLLAAVARLLVLGVAFAATAVACLAFARPLSVWIGRRKIRAEEVRKRLYLDRPLAMSVWGAPVLGASLLAAGIAAGAWLPGIVLSIVAFKALDALPEVALRSRARKFEAQFVESLTGLSNSLKAGLSLPQAIEQVSKDMPAPASEEFGHILQEYRHGKPIEQAFEDAREHLKSRNYDLAVAAFRVGKERGGNVAEVFERIATSIREVWRLEENIRTVSTQGRSSARFMSVMPGVFLVLLYAMDPESTSLLFTDSVGIGVLTVVLVFNLIGHMWIRRILAVDI